MTTDVTEKEVEKVIDYIEFIKNFVETQTKSIQIKRLKDFDSTIESLKNAHNTTIQTCCHYGKLDSPEVLPIKYSDRGDEVVLDYDAASFYAGYSMALGDAIEFLSKGGNGEFDYPLVKKRDCVSVFPIYNLVKNRFSPA